jgi:hypothetical protein
MSKLWVLSTRPAGSGYAAISIYAAFTLILFWVQNVAWRGAESLHVKNEKYSFCETKNLIQICCSNIGICSTYFHKNLQYQISQKCDQWEPRWYMRTHGCTDVLTACYHFTRRECFWYSLIHLLTAIGLSHGGSSTVHIYTQTIHRTIQNQ